MPTYDYECEACEGTFEFFHGMTEEPKKKCPTCGKMKLRRLPGGGGGLLFKGSGFYITDYRSDDYKARAKADSDSKSEKPEKSKDSEKSKSKEASKAASKDAGNSS